MLFHPLTFEIHFSSTYPFPSDVTSTVATVACDCRGHPASPWLLCSSATNWITTGYSASTSLKLGFSQMNHDYLNCLNHLLWYHLFQWTQNYKLDIPWRILKRIILMYSWPEDMCWLGEYLSSSSIVIICLWAYFRLCWWVCTSLE